MLKYFVNTLLTRQLMLLCLSCTKTGFFFYCFVVQFHERSRTVNTNDLINNSNERIFL